MRASSRTSAQPTTRRPAMPCIVSCVSGVAVTSTCRVAAFAFACPRGESNVAGKFEVYEDRAGKFQFRLKAGNGEVVASGEAYESRGGARAGCEAVQRRPPGPRSRTSTPSLCPRRGARRTPAHRCVEVSGGRKNWAADRYHIQHAVRTETSCAADGLAPHKTAPIIDIMSGIGSGCPGRARANATPRRLLQPLRRVRPGARRRRWWGCP